MKTILSHANLIDCVEPKVRPDTAVLIEDGRVRAILPSAEAGRVGDAQVIDLKGGYLMPGLWDVHIHPDYLSVDDMPLADQVTLFGHRLATALTESGNRGQWTSAAEINVHGEAPAPGVGGKWDAPIGFPLVPVSAMMLPNNKVLTFSAYTDTSFTATQDTITKVAILDLNPDRRDVHRYVRDLEEVMIRTCADYGLDAGRISGLTGTWLGTGSGAAEKIGAIGVRISRWITSHGFAFNVSTRLEHFQLIVPCGIADRGVTSLERATGRAIPIDEVQGRLVEHFAHVFERDVNQSWGPPSGGPGPAEAGPRV